MDYEELKSEKYQIHRVVDNILKAILQDGDENIIIYCSNKDFLDKLKLYVDTVVHKRHYSQKTTNQLILFNTNILFINNILSTCSYSGVVMELVVNNNVSSNEDRDVLKSICGQNNSYYYLPITIIE